MAVAEVILALIKLSMMLPSVWFPKHSADGILDYCQFRICGTAGDAADLKRNAGAPHP